jgi:hypothetical protein
MAKNRKMRIMIIRSENFLLFMANTHPFQVINLAFPVPMGKQERKELLNNPIEH